MRQPEIEPDLPGKALGPLYSWWRGDPLPSLECPSGFRACVAEDESLLASLAELSPEEVRRRISTENTPYVATLDGLPVAYGWSARGEAHIGEFDLEFHVPEGERYLWDFHTLPEWRGRGFYPLLLQAIIRADTDASVFWIGHEPENEASRRGIVKAGFVRSGELVDLFADGRALVPVGDPERARAASRLLGVPLLEAAACKP